MARIVVVADHDRPRREAMVKLLRDEYEVECLTCDGWDALQAAQAEATTSGAVWNAVVLSSTLPGITKVGFRGKLEAVFQMPPVEQAEIKTVLVLLGASQSAIEVDPHKPFWISTIPGRLDEVSDSLRSLLDPVLQAAPLPRVEWDANDLIFNHQLRMLNPRGEPGIESRVLQRLLQKFRRNCRSAKFDRLAPGYSGSLVLRVNWQGDGTPEQTMLMKVSKYDDLWKIRRTFDHWDKIETSLNPSGLQSAAPKPLEPEEPEVQHGYLVEAAGYLAEFWQFLGNQIGQFDDWEHVHWGAGGRATTSEELLKSIISVLRPSWYDKATWTEERPLWTADDLRQPAGASFPPYGLTGWWKAQILSSLADLSRVGERLSPTNWKADFTSIREWVTKGPIAGSIVTTPERVLLSPIHGDLNKNNILWWREGKRPLLIDFATYQHSAHTLQDFALLETQVQYALMDREADSQIDAIDYSASQFIEWNKQLANLVQGSSAGLRSIAAGAAKKKNSFGMRQAETLIRLIRTNAHEVFDAAVQRSGATASSDRFCQEYATALLYHTLRVIGFDNSVSPFKRMLAVHGAAMLITRSNSH